MKINNMLSCNTFRFSDIKIGQCFVYEQKLYLKTQNDYSDHCVFCISDNAENSFENNVLVQPVHSVITITNYSNQETNIEDQILKEEYTKLKQKDTPILKGYDKHTHNYICPVCGYIVDLNVPKQKYCDRCGQRLKDI